jgi:hypothetical protein
VGCAKISPSWRASKKQQHPRHADQKEEEKREERRLRKEGGGGCMGRGVGGMKGGTAGDSAPGVPHAGAGKCYKRRKRVPGDMAAVKSVARQRNPFFSPGHIQHF